jgi:hypothetical protein
MLAGNKERHRTGRIGWLRAAVLGARTTAYFRRQVWCLVSQPHMRLTAAS